MSNANSEVVQRDELIRTIRGIVESNNTCGVVNLAGFAFDRVPCSRLTIYAIARKHGSEWGYEYEKAEYIASGNRPFQRNHKRGRKQGPYLIKIKTVAAPAPVANLAPAFALLTAAATLATAGRLFV